MYPRTFKIAVGATRPWFEIVLYRGTVPISSTGLSSARFYVQNRADDTMLVNGSNMAIVSTGPPVRLQYAWVTADTLNAGFFNTWIMLFWSPDSAGEYVVGPELTIFEPGSVLMS